MFFFFFFCNLILSFQSWLPGLKTNFYFYVVVFWNSFFFSLSLAFLLSVNVDFVAQSLASGTVEDWEKPILCSHYYYCTFGRKIKQWNSRFENNRQENNLIKTDLGRVLKRLIWVMAEMFSIYMKQDVFQFYFLHQNNLPGNHSLCLSK